MKEKTSTYFRAKQSIGSEPKMEEKYLKNPILKKLAQRMKEDWINKHKVFAMEERGRQERLSNSR